MYIWKARDWSETISMAFCRRNKAMLINLIELFGEVTTTKIMKAGL